MGYIIINKMLGFTRSLARSLAHAHYAGWRVGQERDPSCADVEFLVAVSVTYTFLHDRIVGPVQNPQPGGPRCWGRRHYQKFSAVNSVITCLALVLLFTQAVSLNPFTPKLLPKSRHF